MLLGVGSSAPSGAAPLKRVTQEDERVCVVCGFFRAFGRGPIEAVTHSREGRRSERFFRAFGRGPIEASQRGDSRWRLPVLPRLRARPH